MEIVRYVRTGSTRAVIGVRQDDGRLRPLEVDSLANLLTWVTATSSALCPTPLPPAANRSAGSPTWLSRRCRPKTDSRR